MIVCCELVVEATDRACIGGAGALKKGLGAGSVGAVVRRPIGCCWEAVNCAFDTGTGIVTFGMIPNDGCAYPALDVGLRARA